MRNIFRRHPDIVQGQTTNEQSTNFPGAEGWELVDGFNGHPHQDHSLLQVPSGPGSKAPKHIPDMLESTLPPYPLVWVYFLSKHYPDTEAENFYNRFQFVYWKSFGIKPIENWKALADRWMLQANPRQNIPVNQPKNDDKAV